MSKITIDRAVLEQALEWFEWFHNGSTIASPASSTQVMRTLREALAQPQPVQEQCPECDGTGTVAGSQAHFPCPLCTSQQEAQPLSNEQITKLPVWRHFVGLMPEHHVEITRAIEQAHGITKGTT